MKTHCFFSFHLFILCRWTHLFGVVQLPKIGIDGNIWFDQMFVVGARRIDQIGWTTSINDSPQLSADPAQETRWTNNRQQIWQRPGLGYDHLAACADVHGPFVFTAVHQTLTATHVSWLWHGYLNISKQKFIRNV